MRMHTMFFAPVLGAIGGIALAQATRPADEGRLDYRASRAFDRGDYATALPLLQRLLNDLGDRPAKQQVVRDRIAICQKALAQAATQPSVPAVIQQGFDPTTGKRVPHPAPVKGQVQAMSIKELGNFDYDQDKGGNIPQDVKRLSGSTIRLSGFMIPLDQATKITQFALVPSLFSCCYGQPPQIQHTIVVTCPRGTAVELSPDEVVVEGTLNVQEKRDGGYIVSIFDLAATHVRTKAN